MWRFASDGGREEGDGGRHPLKFFLCVFQLSLPHSLSLSLML